MTHYVCQGDCGGESSRPGVCQAEGCTHEDQPLAECNCDDGLHTSVTEAREHEDESVVDEPLADDE